MIPTEDELIEFVKRHNNLVNFSMVAKFFDINNATVSDLVNDLEKKKKLKIKKLGGSKIIIVPWLKAKLLFIS